MAHSSAEPPCGVPRNEGGRARSTLPGPLRGVLAVLAVGLGYAALAEVTFTLADAGTPAFFPAAGLSLAAFLLAPRRIWPFFLVAIATAEIVLDRSHGIPGGTALLMAVANAAEPMVAASLLLALSGGVVALRTTRDLVRLVGAGAVGALVGAAVGTAAIAQVAGDGGWWPTIGQWWAGDAIGQIVVAPLILSLTRATVSVRPSRPVVEAIVAGAVLVGASVGAYVLAESAVAYLVVAGTLWSGLRFGTRGVAFAGVVTAGIAAAAAAGHIETTLAPGGDAADTLVLVDVFLAVSLVSAHLLATEIHGRHVVEGRLRERELALRAVVDRSPLPITEVDPATGAVLSWNPAAERLFGWTADEAVGSVGLILPPEDADAHADLRRLTIESGEGHEVDVVRVRKDGTRLPVRASAAPIFDEGGVPRRIVVVIQDMSGQKQLESELLHQAQHDALTGLQNRAVLVDRLAHALRLQARHGGALAVLFCDVDRFKVINDSLGHHVGDELLREVGRRIAGAIRDTDTLARFGGDEFVVLAENVTGPRGAVEIARRIGERVAEPYLLEGRELRTSASIGIAVAEGGGAGPDELMRDADAAMYRAKERGRARFEIFDAEMREWTEARLDTEIALREAIRRDELEVHYQPVVSLRDGTVHTVEALVRWRRGGELVSPAVFIPLAEELGLIDEIGAWVMRTSCARLAAWRSMLGGAAPGSVSVNLSPRQVADSALPEHVAAILADTGLPAEALALELTESAMLGDADRALESLTALRDLGLRLAIDDFGTGYSSLSYLRRLPVDIVKIDRSFLLQLGTNPQDATIVGAVVDLAHSLGLDVVAEGIETPEQLRELVRLGCDHVQGFLLARPLPEAELVPVLARGGLLGAHLPERLAG